MSTASWTDDSEASEIVESFVDMGASTSLLLTTYSLAALRNLRGAFCNTILVETAESGVVEQQAVEMTSQFTLAGTSSRQKIFRISVVGEDRTVGIKNHKQ